MPTHHSPTLYLWIALGGALGSMVRFWLSTVIANHWGESFPWGTLIVNIIGCFVIGFFATFIIVDEQAIVGPSGRHFFMTGVLGGFTTFSSFSLQTLGLARDGAWGKAGGYVAASVGLCLLGVWLGHVVAAALRAKS